MRSRGFWRLVFVLALLPWVPPTSASIGARPAGTVTYFAYDGFLIEAEGRKALVDALMVEKWYAPPGPELPAQMVQGRAPFDRVDVLLVTHLHPDHFNAGPVAAFLRNHPETTLIAHREVVDQLRGLEGFASFRPRVREVALEPGQVARFDLPGIRIDAVPLFHVGGQQTWDVAYSVDLGGFRFFHTGDATFDENAEELNAFPFRALQPDILFFQYFDRSAATRSFIQRRIQPTHMIAMHFTPSEFDAVSKDVKTDFPAAVIPKHLDRRVFEAGQTPWRPEGDYLDQTPPRRPEVFARGLVSTDNLEHSAPAFSPDGTEVFWSLWRRPPRVQDDREVIMTSRRVDGAWTAPAAATFSGTFSDGGPVFSGDGKRLIFASKRPLGGEATPREHDLWMVERQGDTWGEPTCLDFLARFPDLKRAFQPSVAGNGTLYFEGHAEGPMNGYAIYRSAWVNGQYAKPELLPASINAPGRLNWTPFITADESVLLFSSDRRAPGLEWGDIWMCRRRADGGWDDPVILTGAINTNRQERFPALSPGGKAIFFTRPTPGRNHDVYWVEAGSLIPSVDPLGTGRRSARMSGRPRT